VLLGLAAIVAAILAILVVLVLASSQMALVGLQPAPAPAPPALPRSLPTPVPEVVDPPESPPVEIVLASEPLGASVWENDQFVCDTPCTILHPPHAPLPRTFVFKAEGYRDDVYEMTEAKGPIAVALHRIRPSAPSTAPSNPGPRPTIGRDR
jgi:hypothetical protein